jgi:hypothetical protein
MRALGGNCHRSFMGFQIKSNSYLRGAAAALRVEVIATMVDMGSVGIEGKKEVYFKELAGTKLDF